MLHSPADLLSSSMESELISGSVVRRLESTACQDACLVREHERYFRSDLGAKTSPPIWYLFLLSLQMLPPLLPLRTVAYLFVIISWYWRLMTQNYLDCHHLHITDIYIHILRLGLSDPCLLITLVGPSYIRLLAGRNDGRLGHISCKSGVLWR